MADATRAEGPLETAVAPITDSRIVSIRRSAPRGSAAPGTADASPDVDTQDRGHLLVRLAQEVVRRLARPHELDL